MLLDALKRLTSGPKPLVLLFLLLLTSLYLMSRATQNSALFGQIYSLLLAINLLALLLLVALIARNLIGLVQQYRQRSPGARLTLRMVVVFVILAVTPVTVLFYFSLQFLHRGIDSWFDLRIEETMDAALELGRTAMDDRLRELMRQSRAYSEQLEGIGEAGASLELSRLLTGSDASEMTLLTVQGRLIASSSSLGPQVVPNMPNDDVLRQLRLGLEYAALEPLPDSGLHLRVAVPATSPAGEQPRILHALYPIEERLGRLAETVQESFAQYRELAYLRQPLIYSFTLTLSLVLLLSLLTAVWAAFFSARRLVAPIRDLADGTRAVAEGNYDKQLPLPGRDELGFLVRSFNEMTRKIALSRNQARLSQQRLEEQRAYLETVLGHLSSGVLTLGDDGHLYTGNSAAEQILDINLQVFLGQPLEQLGQHHPVLEPLIFTLRDHLDASDSEWQEEITLFGSRGRQMLMCRGSALPGEAERGGYVIVFDDLTELVQAQRDAAWGEVARRLAHEIKNPLTPIQLSAERLRRKYLPSMASDDAEVLDRATHTIVQQVESMKEMVQAFSDYARTPRLNLVPLDLNVLIHEVLELYRGNHRLHAELQLTHDLPPVEADAGRLRQLLHNLVKNALEAGIEATPVKLEISSRCLMRESCRFVELVFRDHGPGFPDQLLGHIFEPYVTSKPKGSGLGLAIVKKIVEEHGGVIYAANAPDGGALLTIRLPSPQGASRCTLSAETTTAQAS